MATSIPKYHEFINPTLQALHKLGGSASIQEIVDEIIVIMQLSDEVVSKSHGDSAQTEVAYRAAWARTYLKKNGLIDNSERAVWSLTPVGRETKKVDTREIIRVAQKQVKDLRDRKQEIKSDVEDASFDSINGSPTWRDQIIEKLYSISPDAFERLCQRILREAGFIEVEVTGRSGDGGIDGHGTIRLGGFISFNVLFQSKRYKSNIGPDIVREFRGAMTGRADKGLIITTGGFTREARKEATRDGAPPIDLIDGELLVEKLKELRLGVEVKLVESVTVTPEWFDSI